jgi:hypothetical protein
MQQLAVVWVWFGIAAWALVTLLMIVAFTQALTGRSSTPEA